jgi:hypothetical protein
MRQRTRDVLLWLAGLGGAAVLLRALLDVLFWASSAVSAVALGVLLVLGTAASTALLLVRSRLQNDRSRSPELLFSETRP